MPSSETRFIVRTSVALAAHAADEAREKKGEGKRSEVTAEQKALRKEMVEKYDTNKDGKPDKEERAKMSEEDKAKMKEARAPKAKKTE
jgi:hypothetical protein